MNTFGNKSLTRWSVVLATVLFVASCGGDNDDDVAVNDGSATPTSTGTPAGTDNSNTPNETGTNGSTDPADNVALPENAFATTLSGAEEVPAVTTNATGTGVVVIDPDTLAMKATIVTAGITGTAAHIHIAPPGVAGPIVFPLMETSTASGIWTTQATLTATQLADLRAGNYYFNVHSAAYPDGEIRGQILRGTNNGTTGTGTATTSTQTTGTGGTTTSGTGTTQPGSATSTIGTDTAGTATSGSDTMGTGTTGTTTTGTTTTGTGTTGTTGTATTDGDTSTTGPAGTASSTAVSTTTRSTFINVLRGSEQVPANTSSAVAIAVAIFDPVAQTLTSAITTMGLTGTEAHIHQALPGSAGPIIFPLTETAIGSGIWTANAALNDEGVTSVASGFFYFDIHSAAFPNGEVRAQIVPQAGAGGAIGTGTANTDTIENGGTGTGNTSTSGVVSPGTGATGTGTTSTGATSPAITSPTGTTPTGTTPTGTSGA